MSQNATGHWTDRDARDLYSIPDPTAPGSQPHESEEPMLYGFGVDGFNVQVDLPPNVPDYDVRTWRAGGTAAIGVVFDPWSDSPTEDMPGWEGCGPPPDPERIASVAVTARLPGTSEQAAAHAVLRALLPAASTTLGAAAGIPAGDRMMSLIERLVAARVRLAELGDGADVMHHNPEGKPPGILAAYERELHKLVEELEADTEESAALMAANRKNGRPLNGWQNMSTLEEVSRRLAAAGNTVSAGRVDMYAEEKWGGTGAPDEKPEWYEPPLMLVAVTATPAAPKRRRQRSRPRAAAAAKPTTTRARRPR